MPSRLISGVQAIDAKGLWADLPICMDGVGPQVAVPVEHEDLVSRCNVCPGCQLSPASVLQDTLKHKPAEVSYPVHIADSKPSQSRMDRVPWSMILGCQSLNVLLLCCGLCSRKCLESSPPLTQAR